MGAGGMGVGAVSMRAVCVGALNAGNAGSSDVRCAELDDATVNDRSGLLDYYGGLNDSLVDRLGDDGLLVLDDITVEDGLDLLNDGLVYSLLNNRGVLHNVNVGLAGNSDGLRDDLRGNDGIMVDLTVLHGHGSSGVLGRQYLGLVNRLYYLRNKLLLDITSDNGLDMLGFLVVDLLLNELDIMGDGLDRGTSSVSSGSSGVSGVGSVGGRHFSRRKFKG